MSEKKLSAPHGIMETHCRNTTCRSPSLAVTKNRTLSASPLEREKRAPWRCSPSRANRMQNGATLLLAWIKQFVRRGRPTSSKGTGSGSGAKAGEISTSWKNPTRSQSFLRERAQYAAITIVWFGIRWQPRVSWQGADCFIPRVLPCPTQFNHKRSTGSDGCIFSRKPRA